MPVLGALPTLSLSTLSLMATAGLEIFIALLPGGGTRCFGPLPDTITYNTMIFSFFKHNMRKVAFGYLSLMWKSLSPNIVTYGMLIDVLCKLGDLRSARFCSFDDMGVRGIYPNMLFDRMLELSLSPNIVTYTALIDGLCKKGMMGGSAGFREDA
ncbi:hypothetical protein HPP92_004249 [Vanilla planifolia]|uniref:Pentatricopeptide repeat-containing protein n=1 Tax=Vanilla planifolia TaxID=51239 RepID=A0A835RZ45_VANPL|nr:hypothetical protein HPP92_004249 [Vanilla planifolia]